MGLKQRNKRSERKAKATKSSSKSKRRANRTVVDAKTAENMWLQNVIAPGILTLLIIAAIVTNLYLSTARLRQRTHSSANSQLPETAAYDCSSDTPLSNMFTPSDSLAADSGKRQWLGICSMNAINPRFRRRDTGDCFILDTAAIHALAEYRAVAHIRVWKLTDLLESSLAQQLSAKLRESFLDESERTRLWNFVDNCGNAKRRGNEQIVARSEMAKAKSRRNEFSYIKYEFEKGTALFQAVSHWMNSSVVLSLVSAAVGERVAFVSDLFVTAYGSGQFLSAHNDLGLGKYAFVLGLSADWRPADGGVTQFHCETVVCLEQAPVFNSLLLFQTHPYSVWHSVTPVANGVSEPRLAVTGWLVPDDGVGFTPDTAYFNQLGNSL